MRLHGEADLRTACLATALLLAAGTGAAQNRITENQARSYVQSAFITGVAEAILDERVVLGPQLREHLALPPDAGRDRIYQAIFALTEDKPLRVRKAGTTGGHPTFALEGGARPLLMVYDLDRNAVAFVALADTPAAAGGTPPRGDEPKAMRVADAAPVPSRAPAVPAVMRLKPIAFGFDDATLSADAKAQLEREGLPKIIDIPEMRYIVHGHADRLGGARYNQQLSEQRAAAVRDYLIEKGVPARLIQSVGLGSSMPQTDCPQKNRRALIECLAPDRRVSVEIQPPPL